MFIRVIPMLSLLGLAACGSISSSVQTDDEALRTVVKGWSVGAWNEIHSSLWNEETGRWEDSSEESPWSEWSVEAVEPDVVEFAMSDGARTRVALRDGMYRDLGPVTDGLGGRDALDVPIVAATVESEEEWQLFMQWPAGPDEPEDMVSFSELTRTGDLFTWSNWSGSSFEDKRRMTISVNRIGR